MTDHRPILPVMDRMSFDKNFLAARKRLGLTQAQMSELTGVHVNSVKVYESGQSQPSLEVFKKIAVALSMSADDLLFDHGERGPDTEAHPDLGLKFEALSRLPEIDQITIANLIDSLVVKNQTLTLATLIGEGTAKAASAGSGSAKAAEG